MLFTDQSGAEPRSVQQQLNHAPTKLLIVGASGTGKTTFLCRYISGTIADRIFVFDHQGELSSRLHCASVFDSRQLCEAVSQNCSTICYDPADEYAGDLDKGFDFFCDFAFEVSRNEPGRKFLVVDDLQELSDSYTLAYNFRRVWQTGRRAGLDAVLISHGMNQTNSKIRNGLTEVVAFQNLDPNALDFLAWCGLDPAAVARLPAGSYLARQTRLGRSYAGKVF